MSIYCDNRIPYTYLLRWTSQNKCYYGKRTAKNCHPTDIWKSYFTSSVYVAEFVKEHGDPDVIEIRKTFDSSAPVYDRIKQCSQWEEKFLAIVNAATNPMFLNRSNSVGNFDNTFHVTVVDSVDGKIKQITSEQYNNHINSDRYTSIHSGSVVVREKNSTEYKRVSVEEYYSNKHLYKHPSSDTVYVMDKESGNNRRITCEEFHVNRDRYKHHSEDTKLSNERIEEIRNLHLNKPKTEDHKEKIATALKLYERTPEHQANWTESRRSSPNFKKLCDAIIINGVEYESISEAARQFKLSHSYLCNMLSGRKKIRPDFWEFRKA